MQEQLIEATARIQETWQRTEARCAGIAAPDHQLTSVRHLLAASAAGSAAARRAFVSYRLSVSDLLRQPELARIYAEHAPRLFEDMWSNGDPRAIDLLHSFANPRRAEDRSAVWHAIPERLRDPQLTQALWNRYGDRVLVYWHPRSGPRLRANDPPLSAEALAEANRLWDQLFENSALVASEREERRRYLETPLKRGELPPEPDPCG